MKRFCAYISSSGFQVLAALGCVFIALSGSSRWSQAAVLPSELPLVSQADISYVGAFALPKETYGTSRFGYGGGAISVYRDSATGKLTLFIHGHIQKNGQIAQVEVPENLVSSPNWANLPVANVLQPFVEVTEDRLPTVGDNANAIQIYGTLAYHGRLIVAASQYYGADQTVSHGVSGLTLSTVGDFKGFFGFTGATAIPRALGGWMTIVPEAWRSLLGGPALTGNGCIPIISATSVGPAATVFNPDDVGVTTPIPGKTLLFYPLGNGTMPVGNEASQNDTLNLTTRIGGMAFPIGSRSLLYFGGHGVGPYCYGTPQYCNNDTALPDAKGPHAQPYRFQVWAYDVNDLLAVKNGTKPAYGPKPYGVWDMSNLGLAGTAVNMQSAGFDPESGLWFISTDYGESPRIDVVRVRVPGASLVKPSPGKSSPRRAIDVVCHGNFLRVTSSETLAPDTRLSIELYDLRGALVSRYFSPERTLRGAPMGEMRVDRPGSYFVSVKLNGLRVVKEAVVVR